MGRMANRFFFVLLTLALAGWFLAMVPQPLWADVTGTILGNVADPTGAAVSGAHVTLQNSLTGLIRRTVADSTGGYEFLDVPIGAGYSVTAESQGFEKMIQSGITLLVNQRFRADFQLRVGAVTQSVSVSAQAAQVETANTQLGNVIEGGTITSMPLNGRSYTDLLSLQAGVVPVTSGVADTERPVSGELDEGLFSVNGAQEASNSFLVNGGDVEEERTNGASIVPVLDSIQEFRVVTNNFDAEYGKFAGGIVNVVTKSGTNRFHGDGFEFLRNSDLDSRNFFDLDQTNPVTGQELPGTARGVFRRNQFGGTFGGPILKDRLFFFTDYQGTREDRGYTTGETVVPTPTEVGGNFSDVTAHGLPSLTGTVRGDNASGDFASTLSNRLGYTVTAGEPYWFAGCSSTAQCVFPGQVIPQAAFSPAAKGLLQFFPAPADYLSSGTPIWLSSAYPTTLRDDKWAERIDLNSQRTGMWSFYYHFDDSFVLNPFTGGDVPGFPGTTPSRGQQVNLRNTHSFGSTAVNVLMLNYTRLSLFSGEPNGQGLGNVSKYGFVSGGLGIIPTAPQFSGVPTISLAGAYSVNFGVPNSIVRQNNDTYQIADHFSKVAGRHSLSIGADGRYYEINTRQNINENGVFEFYGEETGNDFADFLLGAPDWFGQSSPQLQNGRTKYFAAYGQDSFKLSPNLTLNYGLRWEVSTPFYDTEGMIQAFIPGLQSKIFVNSPTGWVFPGDPGVPSTIAPTRYDDFAPRLGIAYSPGFSSGALGKIFGGPGKSSIRAGFGVFYTTFQQLSQLYQIGDAPFGNFFVSPTLVYLEEPYKDRLHNNNPGQRFPVAINVPGTNPNLNFAPFQPITTSQVFDAQNTLPYEEQFNLNLQRQIGPSTILTFAYVGSFGHHLLTQIESNPGNISECLHILALFTAAGQPTNGCGPNGEDSIYNISGQTFNGTRPYSVTSGRYLSQGLLDFSYNPRMSTIGNSNYNALQVSLEKRAGPLTFLAGYTYSKSLDDSSGYLDFTNPYNTSLSYALSSFDMTHNFVLSYNYNLPFRHLIKSSAGPLHKVLDGWTVTGITHFTTGLPIPLHQPGDLSLCGCFQSDVDKPNYSGAPIQYSNPRSSSAYQYFSATPFTSETLGAPGNANRRFFHGPGLNNWDVGLLKDTKITESMSVQFRAEFFNIFNHAQFGLPTGTFSSATFGDVTSANDPRIGQFALKLLF